MIMIVLILIFGAFVGAGGVLYRGANIARKELKKAQEEHDKFVAEQMKRVNSENPENFVAAQMKIIKYENPETNAKVTGHAKISARAEPNARLKTTFGIENAFTTFDGDRSRNFIREARTKLKQAVGIANLPYLIDADADWQPLIDSIRKTITRELDHLNRDPIVLAEFIQFVTFKVSLKYLFYLKEEDLSNSGPIKSIASEVNCLWLHSKAEEEKPVWEDQIFLHNNLRAMIPRANPMLPNENPMNWILPAYETMWRAVFRGVLEINFRNAPRAYQWKHTLVRFLEHPTRTAWKQPVAPYALTPLDLVKEILRLYPPTRRIYRKFPDAPDPMQADIEKCHRSSLLAPHYPDRFCPERWLEIKRCAEEEGIDLKKFEENLGFFPFAFSCPAGSSESQGFGLKMIALLVAAMLQAFDRLPGEWELVPRDDNDTLPPTRDIPLRSGREDYLSLEYSRVYNRKGEVATTYNDVEMRAGIEGEGVVPANMMANDTEEKGVEREDAKIEPPEPKNIFNDAEEKKGDQEEVEMEPTEPTNTTADDASEVTVEDGAEGEMGN